MMLYMHIYYCALRGLRAARFSELRVPTSHTLLQLLARCCHLNSPHGAICNHIGPSKNLLATSTGLCNAQEGVSSQIQRWVYESLAVAWCTQELEHEVNNLNNSNYTQG
jgi:hypothetical protein